MPSDGGLGSALVGDKIMINHRHVVVTKLVGEGGFSYVYLVKEISDTSKESLNNTVHGDGAGGEKGSSGGGGGGSGGGGSEPPVQRSGSGGGGRNGGRRSTGSSEKEKREMILKVTSILSRQQRDIAEKEAKLLSRLSHPSIIKMFDSCYRTVPTTSGSGFRKSDDQKKERPQHMILMEFCEGGHALDVCTKMAAKGERFDLSTLIIAFGQICNAVSYLHAQRPPIVHRDLKPANFLVKHGAYKLCDFGSAVFGHVDLKTQQARAEAEEVIQKTTTQMFRSPEMVDLFMAKKLTQATDVWALGCCLYSLAFLQNCFEEGSNLAILSRKFKIPDDNPYGDGLVELIDRMLTIDSKARADMTEVILCLSAVYSGRPLPPRKEKKGKDGTGGAAGATDGADAGGDGGGASTRSASGDASSSGRNKDKTGGKKASGGGRYKPGGVDQPDLTIDPKVLEQQQPAKKTTKKSDALSRRLEAAAAAAGQPAAAFGNFDADFSEFDQRTENSAHGGGGGSGGGNDIFAASFDDDVAIKTAAANTNNDFSSDWGKNGADPFSEDAGADSEYDEDGGDNDGEDGGGGRDRGGGSGKERPKRRSSGSNRKRREGHDDPDRPSNSHHSHDEEGRSSGSRHGPRRSRSSSKRQGQRSSGKDGEDGGMEQLADAVEEMHANDDEDRHSRKKSTRKGSGSGGGSSRDHGSGSRARKAAERSAEQDGADGDGRGSRRRAGSRDGMLTRSNSRRKQGGGGD